MQTPYQPYEHEDLLLEEEVKKDNNLVLYNDDVNTFDWVIESLIKVCKHQPEQAEQCSYIIHYNGKCAVKEGSFDHLRPLCEALLDRGLSASIE
ncbi:ATP-dependent Clp protease adaptor ClpS [soil metagenome]